MVPSKRIGLGSLCCPFNSQHLEQCLHTVGFKVVQLGVLGRYPPGSEVRSGIEPQFYQHWLFTPGESFNLSRLLSPLNFKTGLPFFSFLRLQGTIPESAPQGTEHGLLLLICSVSAYARRCRPAGRPLPSQVRFPKHRRPKEAHARVSALSLMGRGFSFHTATGKNINTVGGAARQQGPGRRAQARGKEAGSRPRRARSGLPVPTGPCSARWGCTLGADG